MFPKGARQIARQVLDAISATLREREYRRKLITHVYHRAAPRIQTSFAPERKPLDPDIEAASRVLNAWHKTTHSNPAAPVHSVDDLWDGIAAHHHGELITLLQDRNPAILAEYLCNMSRHGATVGITQGETEFRKASTSAQYRHWVGFLVLDRLVALAEAVGVLRAENPEQGRWGENLYENVDNLIDRLQAKLGVRIAFPEVEGCLLGLDSKSGRISFRDVTALYAAWRIRTITNHHDRTSICEIGAGLGRVAYYCAQFGIENYVIYDLPLVNVLQGYFLIRTMPGSRVVLYGEEGLAGGQAIKVLPNWALKNAASKSHDLVLNQDSFPEIERSTVQEYLREIRRTTRGYFLSINHEAETPMGESSKHLVVSEAIEEVGGFERQYRFPCWVRAGYVEELYKVL